MKPNHSIQFLLAITIIVTAPVQAFAGSIQYTYDNMDRLAKAVYEDGTVIQYFYDAAGNRTSMRITTGSATSGTASPDEQVVYPGPGSSGSGDSFADEQGNSQK
jgi:YD repeat-containing protein